MELTFRRHSSGKRHSSGFSIYLVIGKRVHSISFNGYNQFVPLFAKGHYSRAERTYSAYILRHNIVASWDRLNVDWSSVQVDGVDSSDYPKFCDAYLSYAEFENGTPLSEAELEQLSEDSDVNQFAFESLL